MKNTVTEIVFLEAPEGYERAWTWHITLPRGADFYAAVELAKKLAKIPEMLSVVFLVDFNRFDLVGPFPGKLMEKDYDQWVLEKPTLLFRIYYRDKSVYPALHNLLLEEYKALIPGIDMQSGV